MKQLRFSFYNIILLFILLNSCVSENRNQKIESVNTEIINQERSKEKIKRIKKIFYSLPSPLELTLLFKKEGVNYHAEKMHDISRRDDYIGSTKKALNLGVYGADLSYAGLFGKHQDAIQYFTATQLLAQDIGIGQTFQKEFISRLEKNANNKDTLLAIISEFFLENDSYLKDQKQQDISTYVLAGGWIEGMYLGTHMADENIKSQGIREIIAGQKYSLHNLMILLQNIGENGQTNELILSMGELESSFQQLILDDNGKSVTARKENNVLQITSDSLNFILPDSSLEIIKSKVANIRNSILE